ncbi:hypothetical protein C8Q73DRAFT_668815 [Cubamyces lactineus]|nr:hypothetical protein C8Q73DRAFT_668815 [Cubamyces lactineus]
MSFSDLSALDAIPSLPFAPTPVLLLAVVAGAASACNPTNNESDWYCAWDVALNQTFRLPVRPQQAVFYKEANNDGKIRLRCKYPDYGSMLPSPTYRIPAWGQGSHLASLETALAVMQSLHAEHLTGIIPFLHEAKKVPNLARIPEWEFTEYKMAILNRIILAKRQVTRDADFYLQQHTVPTPQKHIELFAVSGPFWCWTIHTRSTPDPGSVILQDPLYSVDKSPASPDSQTSESTSWDVRSPIASRSGKRPSAGLAKEKITMTAILESSPNQPQVEGPKIAQSSGSRPPVAQAISNADKGGPESLWLLRENDSEGSELASEYERAETPSSGLSEAELRSSLPVGDINAGMVEKFTNLSSPSSPEEARTRKKARITASKQQAPTILEGGTLGSPFELRGTTKGLKRPRTASKREQVTRPANLPSPEAAFSEYVDNWSAMQYPWADPRAQSEVEKVWKALLVCYPEMWPYYNNYIL